MKNFMFNIFIPTLIGLGTILFVIGTLTIILLTLEDYEIKVIDFLMHVLGFTLCSYVIGHMAFKNIKVPHYNKANKPEEYEVCITNIGKDS